MREDPCTAVTSSPFTAGGRRRTARSAGALGCLSVSAFALLISVASAAPVAPGPSVQDCPGKALSGWVVRGVRGDRAWIAKIGGDGVLRTVQRGVTDPDLGQVLAITRVGGNWAVETSGGIVYDSGLAVLCDAPDASPSAAGNPVGGGVSANPVGYDAGAVSPKPTVAHEDIAANRPPSPTPAQSVTTEAILAPLPIAALSPPPAPDMPAATGPTLLLPPPPAPPAPPAVARPVTPPAAPAPLIAPKAPPAPILPAPLAAPPVAATTPAPVAAPVPTATREPTVPTVETVSVAHQEKAVPGRIPTAGPVSLDPEDSGVEMIWEAQAGDDLQDLLVRWCLQAGKSQCQGVAWQTNRRYPLQGSASFTGAFDNVVDTVIRAFGTAPRPPLATLSSNHMLIIESADDRGG